jgi:ketosteroid isomerase-like protein
VTPPDEPIAIVERVARHVSSVGVELQHLIDERDIVRVALTYCRALDTCDWDLLATVFVPDATARLGSPTQLTGSDEIVDRCRRALSPLELSQHLVGNHEVVVDGDRATHHCYLHAQHVRANVGGDPNYIVAGRYQDRFVRTGDGWRIAHRDLVMMWTAGNPEVIGH